MNKLEMLRDLIESAKKQWDPPGRFELLDMISEIVSILEAAQKPVQADES
jgi:hypothetical protein